MHKGQIKWSKYKLKHISTITPHERLCTNMVVVTVRISFSSETSSQCLPPDHCINATFQFLLPIISGWTGKDGSPSPTLGTIIKKSYNGSSVLSTSLGSKMLNNTSLGLGGIKI